MTPEEERNLRTTLMERDIRVTLLTEQLPARDAELEKGRRLLDELERLLAEWMTLIDRVLADSRPAFSEATDARRAKSLLRSARAKVYRQQGMSVPRIARRMASDEGLPESFSVRQVDRWLRKNFDSTT